MGANGGTIERPLLPVELTLLVQFDLQGLEDAVPSAIAAPAYIAVVDRLPGTVAFGDIAPLAAGASAPEDAVDDGAMGVPGMAGSLRNGQERFDKLEVDIAQFMAAHRISSPMLASDVPAIRWYTTTYAIARQSLVLQR